MNPLTKEQFFQKFSKDNPYIQGKEGDAAYQVYLANQRNPFGIQMHNPWLVDAQHWEDPNHEVRQNWEVDQLKKQAEKPVEIDPRYEALASQQRKLAQDFRAKIPQYTDTAMTRIADQSRRDLATTMAENRSQFNRRGLLYSGGRVAQDAAASGKAAADLQTKRKELNTQLTQTADDLENESIQTGFGIAGMGQNIGEARAKFEGQALEQALERQNKRQEALKGLGAGLGQAAGMATAGLMKPNSLTPTTPGTRLDQTAYTGKWDPTRLPA